MSFAPLILMPFAFALSCALSTAPRIFAYSLASSGNSRATIGYSKRSSAFLRYACGLRLSDARSTKLLESAPSSVALPDVGLRVPTALPALVRPRTSVGLMLEAARLYLTIGRSGLARSAICVVTGPAPSGSNPSTVSLVASPSRSRYLYRSAMWFCAVAKRSLDPSLRIAMW